VEVSCSLAERQAIHLIRKIREFVDGWNNRARPFISTKAAGEVLVKSQSSRCSGSLIRGSQADVSAGFPR
jgi:hypothetical protein